MNVLLIESSSLRKTVLEELLKGFEVPMKFHWVTHLDHWDPEQSRLDLVFCRHDEDQEPISSLIRCREIIDCRKMIFITNNSRVSDNLRNVADSLGCLLLPMSESISRCRDLIADYANLRLSPSIMQMLKSEPQRPE